MKELMKMMEKKSEGKKPLSPEYKEAKGGILKDLMKEMSAMAGSDIKGMNKVTVAAPDAEGLKTGLEKAEELLPEGEESEEDAEMCPECMMEHAPGMHKDEESPEALKLKIAELEAKLAAKGE
jgi:hypothetical protein